MRAAFLTGIIVVATFVHLASPRAGSAAEPVCSFSAQEHFEQYSFSVTSRPAGECRSQSLNIAVQQNARLLAQFDRSSEKLVDSVWAQDLDDDGRPELVVVSHIPANPAAVSLAVFAVEGDTLKEIALPDPQAPEGYRGGERFSRDGGKIVRSYVTYRAGDRDGVPTGEKRVIFYMYRNRELLPVAGREVPAAEKQSVKPVVKIKGNGKVKGAQAPLLKITGISVKSDYLEIRADGPVEKYRVERISSPWRLIIDIAGAVSAMPEKTVAINGLGISNARIGSHKGHLRIVLDSSEESLPTETVTPAEHALRIGFYR